MSADRTQRQRRNARFAGTLRLLASRWRSAGPLWPGFALLAEGHPVETASLAEACRLDIDELERLLTAVRARRDTSGRLLDLFGMTLEPTAQRVTIDDKVVYACCALWAQVIPKLVGRSARVDSADPVDGRRVRLEVSPDGVLSTDPRGAVATMAITTPPALRAGAGAAFCSHVRHFRSLANARRFAAENDARQTVSIVELDEIGSELLRAIRSTATSGGIEPTLDSGVDSRV